jgi:hypothetical protein
LRVEALGGAAADRGSKGAGSGARWRIHQGAERRRGAGARGGAVVDRMRGHGGGEGGAVERIRGAVERIRGRLRG